MAKDAEIKLFSGDYDSTNSLMKLILSVRDSQIEYGVVGAPEFLLLPQNLQEKFVSAWIQLLLLYKESLAAIPESSTQVIH